MPRARKKDSTSYPDTRQRRRRHPSTNGLGASGVPSNVLSSSRSISDSYGTAKGDGYCPAIYECNLPYMDVQTVKNNLTADQAAKLKGQSHCLLFVEPVVLPDLGHTGVQREMLPDDSPLFYMNGYKNCGLGTTIRKALYESSCSNQPKEFDRRHQQPPSELGGSHVPSSMSNSYSRRNYADDFAAVPAYQDCKLLSEVWETRTKECNEEKHKPGSISTDKISKDKISKNKMSKDKIAAENISIDKISTDKVSIDKTIASTLDHAEWGKGSEERSLSEKNTTQLKTGGTLLAESQQEQQQQHDVARYDDDANTPSSGATSTRTSTISSKRSSTLGWMRQNDLFGGGRDSEWLEERRAANYEAQQILDAMKRNSVRMSFLVKGWHS